MGKRWAEYLTFVSTTVLLPLEVYEIIHKGTVLKVIGFLINLAVVIYLLFRKRLFGLRGGGAAEAAERTRDAGWPAIERATIATPAPAQPDAGGLVSSSAEAPELREDAVEPSMRRVGGELAQAFPSSSRHPVRALDARAMEMASSDRELRAALFRFVDVVPACRSLDDLARHLIGFLEEVPDTPPPLSAAMRVSHTKAGRAALGAAAAGGVRHLAHRFIVGETPTAALGTLRQLWDHGVASSVDLLGEATVTEAEADRYAAAARRRSSSSRPPPGTGGPGDAGDRRSRPASPGQRVREDLGPDADAASRRSGPRPARRRRRLRPLLRQAQSFGAHLHIDMESLDSREAVLELVLALLDEPEFRDGPSAGLVLQAYLRDSPDQLAQVIDWAEPPARIPPLTVRLVKGAYWDHELVAGPPARLAGAGV